MKLTLHMFLSLDGVMQAPNGPDDAPDSRFADGGWMVPYRNPEGRAAVVDGFSHASAFLLGRRTYEHFNGFWPTVTDPADPVATKLNLLPKYVVSTTLTSVDWHNSSLLGSSSTGGGVAAEVAKLKELPGDELQLHGSADLAQTLIEHDLIDEYRLFTFPVHIGSGKRLFREGTRPAGLRLLSTSATETGVIIARYASTGPTRSAD